MAKLDTPKEKFSTKLNELVKEANVLIKEGKGLKESDNETYWREYVPKCRGWITSAVSVVQIIFPEPEMMYRKQAEQIVGLSGRRGYDRSVNEITHILQRLIEDIESNIVSL